MICAESQAGNLIARNINAPVRQFCGDTIKTDLVQLIENAEDVVRTFVRNPGKVQQTIEHFSVAELDSKPFDAQRHECVVHCAKNFRISGKR